MVGLLSFLLWVMGGSRPPMLRNKEDEQSKTNQTTIKNEQTKIKSNESICGVDEINEAN